MDSPKYLTTCVPDEGAADPDRDVRFRIALRVLEIVSEFAPAGDTLERAQHGDIDVADGEEPVHALEREIRRLAPDAERTSCTRGNRSKVVNGVLAEEYLLDDYLRIVAVEQHLAFGHDLTPGEGEDEDTRRRHVAEERAEQARWLAQHVKDRMRVCLCGEDYGRHLASRDEFGRRLTPLGNTCWRFENVDELKCGLVRGDVLRKGLTSWVERNDLLIDADGLEAGMRIVAELRAKSPETTGADAFATAAAALAW